MRLLRFGEGDELILGDDLVDNIPPYAVLSHTWGVDEVKFQDIYNKDFHNQLSYRKILFCGEQARRDGLEYFWVDTCCIDKTSSAEIHEAINSMYKWYQESKKCYVYLADVHGDNIDAPSCRTAFEKSRWFTRGWTLQELIAPSVVEFYSSDGKKLGDKKSMELTIYKLTNIPISVLRGGTQHNIPPHSKIAWSNNRETTRHEDKTYSLLGLVGISMSVIYGERDEIAFIRLCIELIQHYPIYSDYTPLVLAARSGHVGALRVLLKRGVDIESKQANGFSALAWAAYEGHEAAIQVLLEKGANIESKTNRGHSPLALAADQCHEASIRVLLGKGANTESKDTEGLSPLARAAEHGHEGAIRALLDKRANIESRDEWGYSPLARAAGQGHEAAIRVFLDEGANIESKDMYGFSPLNRAAYKGHEGVIPVLLDKGANIESKNYEGYSPLGSAADQGHDGAVRVLLDRGANIESKDKGGNSPLSIAASRGHVAAVRILLDRRANIKTRNKKLHTPTKRAFQLGHSTVFQLLRERRHG